MRNLFATTAMALALGLPAVVAAQTATTETAPTEDAQTGTASTSNFLASRGASDMLATDLIGHVVYARRTDADMQAMGTATTTLTATDIEGMDNVGEINDVILSADGKVQALVIGVGGFIGVGEQDVAVTMDQVSFATDATQPDEMYVVINTSGEMLKTSPAFDRTATMGMTNESMATTSTTTDTATTDTATTDATTTDATTTDATAGTAGTETMAETSTGATAAERERLTAPALDREGYAQVAVGDISLDLLMGKTVYGADDTSVGTVEDVIVDESGAVKDVIIDFGGFLGMGSTQVALSFDELTILSNDGNADVRVYVEATKEQVEAMPTYTPVN